jgi:hypothetical protein
MGHQIPYFGAGKIGNGEGLKVNKQAVSERLFDSTRRPQEGISPDISKTPDAQSKDEDFQSIDKKAKSRNHPRGEIIDGIFDDPRDEELEDINDEQSKEPDQDPIPVDDKIILESSKGVHTFTF